MGRPGKMGHFGLWFVFFEGNIDVIEFLLISELVILYVVNLFGPKKVGKISQRIIKEIESRENILFGLKEVVKYRCFLPYPHNIKD